MEAFAQLADLSLRLGQDFDAADLNQIAQLLDDASEHLRSIIGQAVWPAATVTFDLWAEQGDRILQLPVGPVRSVTSVTIGGLTVAATLVRDRLYLAVPINAPSLTFDVHDPIAVTVTLVVGVASAPKELTSWTCVLASQALASTSELGTLGSGEVTGIGIDDYRKSFATSGDGIFNVPPAVADRLRAKYGGGSAVVRGSH